MPTIFPKLLKRPAIPRLPAFFLPILLLVVLLSRSNLKTLPLPHPPSSTSKSHLRTPHAELSNHPFTKALNWTQAWQKPDRTFRVFRAHTPKASYLYCSVGKAGCTFHMGLLHRIYGTVLYEHRPTIHDGPTNRKWHLSRLSPTLLSQLLLDPTYHRYVIVRNPIARTLSAYRNKVEDPQKDPALKTVSTFHSWVFEQFPVEGQNRTVDELARMNIHWAPQYIHCGMHEMQVFTVFKFEEPLSFINYLESFVPAEYLDHGWGDDRNLSFRQFQLGPRERTGHVQDNFYNYYDRLDVFDRVREQFQEDIDMFGYGDEVKKMRRVLVQKLHTNNQTALS